MDSPFLTVNEAAEYLRVKPITMYKWLKKGLVPGAFKCGILWRIRKDGLDGGVPLKGEK